MEKINLKECLAAQDMVCIIAKKNMLSVEEAIKAYVNEENFNSILKTGWAGIALDLWGHGEPKREWSILDEPCIEVEFDESQLKLIKKVMKKENVDIETALSYFLIFAMDSLGYHI